MDHRPIGVISADETGLAIAAKIAASGQRVVFYAMPGAPRHMTDAAPRPGKIARVEMASTPTDVAFECEIVFVSIDDTAELRRILLGTPERMGIAAEMSPGSVIVDTGARPPRETQALLGITGTRGVALIDAALIGGAGHAADSAPTVLVGGFPDAVDRAMPVLEILGRVERTGPLGSAHTAAALMGYMEAAHRVAREDAAAVGRALGLTPETLQRVLDGAGETGSIVQMAQRTKLAGTLAQNHGVSADVIDFTQQKLASSTSKSR